MRLRTRDRLPLTFELQYSESWRGERRRAERWVCKPHCIALKPACWNSILTGRACDKWRTYDLVLAVQLARTQAKLVAETERLAVERMVITSAKADGHPISTPQGTSGNANGVYIA